MRINQSLMPLASAEEGVCEGAGATAVVCAATKFMASKAATAQAQLRKVRHSARAAFSGLITSCFNGLHFAGFQNAALRKPDGACNTEAAPQLPVGSQKFFKPCIAHHRTLRGSHDEYRQRGLIDHRRLRQLRARGRRHHGSAAPRNRAHRCQGRKARSKFPSENTVRLPPTHDERHSAKPEQVPEPCGSAHLQDARSGAAEKPARTCQQQETENAVRRQSRDMRPNCLRPHHRPCRPAATATALPCPALHQPGQRGVRRLSSGI